MGLHAASPPRFAVLLLLPALVLALMPAMASSATEVACPGHGVTFEPPDGTTLLVVGQDRDSTEDYVSAVGVVPGGFMTYSSVAGPVLGLHLPINFGGTSHGQHFVDRYPDSVMQVAVQMTPLLVNLGLLDTQIRILGDWITSTQRPVYLRIGYEFDHVQHENDPDEFITAWRRVVDRLRAQGVSNVAYVWHSAGNDTTYRNLPPSAWYPGDDYVDWVAVSIFPAGFGWNPQPLVKAHWIADFGDEHGKPMMIAESTPHGADAASADPDVLWDSWHQNVADFIADRGVKAWSYINQNWEEVGWPGWGDSRVQANPTLQARWLAETTKPRYLQASPSLFCTLGY